MDDYITGMAAVMYGEGVPQYMILCFIAEAKAHPDEYPTMIRGTNCVYPDAHSWEQKTRCYEPGILYWTWADGTGFPPPREDRHA